MFRQRTAYDRLYDRVKAAGGTVKLRWSGNVSLDNGPVEWTIELEATLPPSQRECGKIGGRPRGGLEKLADYVSEELFGRSPA